MKIKMIRDICISLLGVLGILGAASILLVSHPGRMGASPDDSRLGAQWQVSEQGWTGLWVRRGDSNTFDARWNMPGQPEIRGVLDMRLDDRNVRIDRTDVYTNQHCEYRGEISRDWRTAQGWLSCNNGPRVDWSANIYRQGESFRGHPEVVSPPVPPGVRWDGHIIPKYNEEHGSWRFDLTGVWGCNDGGTYYLRQLGNNVWWYGEASNGQWSNIFHGAMDGDLVDGFWLDVPKGRDRSNGALRLHLDSRDEFHREQKTGDDFGGSHWTRIR